MRDFSTIDILSDMGIDGHVFIFTNVSVNDETKDFIFRFKCQYCNLETVNDDMEFPEVFDQKCISDDEKVIKDILE